MICNKIDTSILPHAWLYWETTKDNFWVDCETNEKLNARPNVDFSWRNKNDVKYNSGSRPLCAYAKYHADINRLELAGMTFDTRRTAPSHEWKYAGKRYFIDKEKNVYDENGIFVPIGYTLDKNHYAHDFKNFLQMFHRLNATDKVVKEFHKFLGDTSFTNGIGRCIEAKWTWHIHEWYIRKQKTATGKGKAHMLTNKLTAIPLSDISDLVAKYPARKTEPDRYGYRMNINGILYFERVDDKWSVLRVLIRYGIAGNEFFKETERIYISDNGDSRIVTPAKNGWRPTQQVHDWNNHYFANVDEAMEKCNRIKYVMPIVENELKIKRMLFNILRFPEIEQLAKMGYVLDAKRLASNYTPKAYIKEKFGCYNEKEKTLLKKVGLTKHQLDKHLSDNRNGITQHVGWYGSGDLLTYMREFFGEDFAHLDNATFDKYYDALCIIRTKYNRSYFTCMLNRANIDEKKFVKNMIRLGEKNEHAYNIICDALSEYYHLNRGTEPEINWYFDSYSDAVRAHDALSEMKRVQDAERRELWNMTESERRKKEEEKRIKLDKERQKFEYEDDNFIIRLPKNATEITTEGIAQHICIGSYVSRHSNGETNLFFLRKKSEPDTPFYAIEMYNGNVINQIHGFGNRWLGNNPEAIPTVVRWLRKNGIRCDNKILTCKATGYGSTNDYVPMPVVD